jgi:hypothetical protein
MSEEIPDYLPPEKLPPLEDKNFPPDNISPYQASKLRDVCGTRINSDAIGIYKRRAIATSPQAFPKTCAHPDLELWLNDLSGFDPRTSLTQPPSSEWPLSGIASRVSITNSGIPFAVEPNTYLVDYASLHNNPRTLPDPENYKKLIGENFFPEGSQLLLSFFGERALTLGLWVQPAFWSHPMLDQFTAIIMPDFSAFSDDPWPQSLIGERMHQIFADEGCAAGRNVIPSIAWGSEASLARQVELWTSSYPNINTIRLDCLGHHVDKTGWAWRWLYAIEKYCSGKDHIRWIISGLTAGWMIRELNEIFPKKNYIITTTLSTFISAMRGIIDKDAQALEFQRRLRDVEDFRLGNNVADKQIKPDYWPKFSDVKQVNK